MPYSSHEPKPPVYAVGCSFDEFFQVLSTEGKIIDGDDLGDAQRYSNLDQAFAAAKKHGPWLEVLMIVLVDGEVTLKPL